MQKYNDYHYKIFYINGFENIRHYTVSDVFDHNCKLNNLNGAKFCIQKIRDPPGSLIEWDIVGTLIEAIEAVYGRL